MKKLNLWLTILGIATITAGYSQAGNTSDLNLIKYLNRVNIMAEGEALKNYCNCKSKDEFINAYQDLRSAYNGFVNSYMVELYSKKSKKALGDFREKNTLDWVGEDLKKGHLKIIQQALEKLETSCVDRNEKEGFLPVSATVGELTGLANTIIGLFNSARERRDTQRSDIIKIMDSLKMPSLTIYKCVSPK